MTLEVDAFWSFRSPYSYLATSRMLEFEKLWDLRFNIRPVYPIAIRIDGWFRDANPMWRPYLVRDVKREAERLGMPFRWPRPDPVQMDHATGNVPAEQPYIHRLTRLGVAAARHGRGLAFISEVSALLYGGTVVDWHLGTHLADATARAGLDLAALDREISGDTAGFEAGIMRNQEAHREAGHWGVPTFAFRGEPFFGQDRMDALLWRLRQQGLQPRQA